ncbi:MAG: toxin-antitoxin system HicB family antitoxin [Trueperaceae bacterium]|nr:toxin-antitoxin system HicB family antitoxin [Trueperaceae bacterium]
MVNADRYSTHVFYDEESAGFVAVSPEVPGVSAVGPTRARALAGFAVVLDLALDTFRAEGWPIPDPATAPDPELPSGEFRIRIPRTLHALLSRRAETEGVSQNTLVVALIAHGLACEAAGGTGRSPATEVRSRVPVAGD